MKRFVFALSLCLSVSSMNPTDQTRTYLELQPILPLGEWWQAGLFLLSVILLFSFAIWMIRRDSRTLPKVLTILLSGLRLFAIACLILYLLNPGQRSESRLLTNSKIAMLVDTSLSMGLRDRTNGGVESVRRIDEVVRWIDDSEEIDRLRQFHDVTIYRFGDTSQPEPVLTLLKRDSGDVELGGELRSPEETKTVWAYGFGLATIACAVLSILMFAGWAISYWRDSPEKRDTNSGGENVLPNRSIPANWLSAAVGSMVVTAVLMGASDLSLPSQTIWESLGLQSPAEVAAQNEPSPMMVSTPPKTQEDASTSVEEVVWEDALLPNGTSTSLGSAIQFIVNKERGGPLAGIVVFTDGQSNIGTTLNVAAASAVNANVPIFPVGIGSIEQLQNIEIADVQMPPRVFPGDRFKIKSIVKATGMAGRSVNVQIVSVDENETEAEMLEAETTVTLGDDGEAIPFEIEVLAGDEGKRRYIVRSEAVADEVDQTDNQRGGSVEIVKRKTNVLLIAGGPNREFRFLRNQLYRDEDIRLDVWLQSAKSGADQESDNLLDAFPEDEEDLFFYDCIIAFDADWRMLDLPQATHLERWVAEKAGGLILVAGPVNTPEWTRRPRGDETIDLIRRLYPVSFFSQGTAQLKLGRFGGRQPFPLAFSREGQASRFLWLGESAVDSNRAWDRFEGVFGYYAVNESKTGADVLARFADSETAVDGQLPIYLSSQFYGAGRVFFQASAEMWRVRTVDVEYFQDYYTQLIRWASQGRLLRDSNRGVLLTDRDECWMGDQVGVQAILRSAADEPLMAEAVSATLTRPDGSKQILELKATGGAIRPGTFEAQFPTTLDGEYRITLPVPDSATFDVLSATVRSSIPDLEKAKPQRNDAELKMLADKSQGHYFVGSNEFMSSDSNPLSPSTLIAPQDQETFLTGTLDRFFKRKLMIWLLVWITLSLALEWTIRRLHKLS